MGHTKVGLVKPMLAATASDPTKYLESDLWSIEQKYDGKRLIVKVDSGVVSGYSRKGEAVDVPKPIADAFSIMDSKFPELPMFKQQWLFDGEQLSSTRYVVFDVMLIQGVDTVAGWKFSSRRDFLEKLFDVWNPSTVILARNERDKDGKLSLFKECQNNVVEGVMFRRDDASYSFAKRSTKILKWKFKKTADCVVSELNRKGKDLAIGISLYDDDGVLHEVGGLKLKTWQVEKVEVGTVVEVEYLYATDSNKVYQPIIVCIRDDKDADECTLDQLIKTNEVIV